MIKITNPADCCGCTACASICKHKAIKLSTDEKGFVYPVFNSNLCVNCGLCDNVCPVLNNERRNNDYKAIYAVRVKDEEILMRSSSGGAFYSVASYVITVLNGVVFGVEYDENMVVRHTCTDTIEGLNKYHGSKYVQSDTTGIYDKVKAILIQGRYVLFTGTPCQVMALRLFLKKTYKKLICIDLICHSVPSPLIFKEYVDLVGKRHRSKVVSIDMRNKKYGWSHSFYYYYYFSDGQIIGSEKLRCVDWGKLFFSGLITRDSCNECKFSSYRRTGDITIADFWDDGFKRPEAYSKKGTSLFIINTEIGLHTMGKIRDSIQFWEINKEEAFQPCLVHPVAPNPLKQSFWAYYKKHGFEKSYNKYFVVSKLAKFKCRLKTIAKTILSKLEYLSRIESKK